MGVIIRRYIDSIIILLIPTPLVLALFLAAASLLLCSFLLYDSLIYGYMVDQDAENTPSVPKMQTRI